MDKKWLIGAGLAVAAYIIFMFSTEGGFAANFIAYICLFVIAGQGWNLLGGYIGEISFGHAVFFGIGAYTVGLPIGYGYDLPLFMLVICGALLAGLFALILSYPLLRVQGFPFLVGTFGLGVVMHSIFVNNKALFATRGIFLKSYDKYLLYIIIIVATAAVILFVKWLTEQNIGLSFKAVRDVPIAAQMVGIDIYRTKATALVIGAILTGLSGGLYALYSSFVHPATTFETSISIFILLGPYIGGIGTVLGAAIGSVIVILFQEFSRSVVTISGGHHLLLGLLLVTVMMTSREGIYPGLRKLIMKRLKVKPINKN
ncbi:branched-chain amino acid ABC transporter permease [Acidaminobacter hydrogenoformans]|uniref:Branched-chain amino acid transport system permease protein n=1 Tax=Acidaminobacter hydrogenoformans DSM 2784 TaxID=1120920 RepID=A0A1G5S298_9FIRM|nr:branched-chain amino acid ABC transporter permease [Acidaminobacter hydrogenoformans]SCZ79871.1 branched-chain amino acid transport system permease protein [Acidaminobacter hydrogenoformans DSM 2784]